MPETITLHALDLSGETTLKLFLREDDGTLLNTGGDALAEIGSTGVFQATLGESRVGLGTLNVRVCDTVETADGLLIDDALPESSTVIGSTVTAVLDSAVQTQLDDIEDSIDTYIAGISAVASTTTGTIVGFPSSLNAGDSYTDEANASIHVFIRDASDDPITAVGSFNFTDPEFAPEVNITQSGSTGRVKAVVTFVEASPEDYLKVEIPSSQSRRASPGTATIQCLLKWVDTDGKVLCQKTLSKQAVTWNEMV